MKRKSKLKLTQAEQPADVEFHNRHVDMFDNRGGVDPDLAARFLMQAEQQQIEYLASLPPIPESAT